MAADKPPCEVIQFPADLDGEYMFRCTGCANTYHGKDVDAFSHWLVRHGWLKDYRND